MSLTNDQITAKNFKEFYEAIRPYLNGSFPTVIANKFDKANLYSTDEQIVGRWIDGKPLYQRTIEHIISGAGTNPTTEVIDSTFTVENYTLVNVTGLSLYNNTSDSWNFDISSYSPQDGNVLRVGQERNNGLVLYERMITSGRKLLATIQYTKTADSAMEIGSDTDYSTTEKIVGTWIDGKPLYQKTFQFTSPSSVGQFDISGTDTIDTLVTLDGYELNTNGWRTRLNSYQSSTSYSFINFSGTTKKFYCGSTNDHLGLNIVMTLTYTKTTDSTS
jgi:hypothetical protein